jgi:hypothetical protein
MIGMQLLCHLPGGTEVATTNLSHNGQGLCTDMKLKAPKCEAGVLPTNHNIH